jgi:hypothetical protein
MFYYNSSISCVTYEYHTNGPIAVLRIAKIRVVLSVIIVLSPVSSLH